MRTMLWRVYTVRKIKGADTFYAHIIRCAFSLTTASAVKTLMLLAERRSVEVVW